MERLPLELKKDDTNLWYINNLFVFDQLNLDKREFKLETKHFNTFYRIPSTNDYIIKCSNSIFTKKAENKIKEMLMNLLTIGRKITSIDFPIGYYQEDDYLRGLIIRYYENSPSLYDLSKNYPLEELFNYYQYDNNLIHNLFMLFHDVLDLIEEMCDNNILYTDISYSNILLYKNKPKLIDFDYRFVHFNNQKKYFNVSDFITRMSFDDYFKMVITNYFRTIREILEAYGFNNFVSIEHNNFNEARSYVKILENRVRGK